MGAALLRLTFALLGLLFCQTLLGAQTSMQADTLASNIITIKALNNQGQPASNMVVYATPKTGLNKLKKNTKQLIIDQQGKKFAPYVTVVQKGQAINFANKDDITHHIYSVLGENRFDFKLQAGSTKQIQTKDTSEEIAMGCNIHDWMSGYVLVVDTPLFTKTNAQGVATLNVAHFGDYTITVWHPQLDVATNRISQSTSFSASNNTLLFELNHPLLPIPAQTGQDEFDFIEEYE